MQLLTLNWQFTEACNISYDKNEKQNPYKHGKNSGLEKTI